VTARKQESLGSTGRRSAGSRASGQPSDITRAYNKGRCRICWTEASCIGHPTITIKFTLFKAWPLMEAIRNSSPVMTGRSQKHTYGLAGILSMPANLSFCTPRASHDSSQDFRHGSLTGRPPRSLGRLQRIQSSGIGPQTDATTSISGSHRIQGRSPVVVKSSTAFPLSPASFSSPKTPRTG
jgi:hypothetical protein